MRLAFIESGGWEYDATTPYKEPMGGSQSALCYLTVELAKLGHEVVVFNGNKRSVKSLGVHFVYEPDGLERFPINSFDVVIFLNGAYGRKIREQAGIAVPLLMWNHHAFFQEAIRDLSDPEEQAAWDKIIFVSESQREPFIRMFGVDPDKTVVMHNGASPAFENIELSQPPWFETGRPPVLFYSSTPYRGLDVLLDAFPAIRKAIPDVTLKIFSSMAVYRLPDDEYRHLFDLARVMDGVEYVGSVGQAELAKRIAGYAALAHPSTFPECHSIAAIEAMVSGAMVLTTDLGGQREVTGDLAHIIPHCGDKKQLAQDFSALAIKALSEARNNPEKAARERQLRIDFARAGYLWRDRARVWSDWLQGIAR